ncbi:MAG: cellulase family glycosylhydrolase [Planctomycetota bacterium]|nr:cellulase family glycosylhydrolase [Planctomycetota bacterium]
MVSETMLHAVIRQVLVCAVSTLFTVAAWAAEPAPASAVPPARLAKLTQGINLSHWFGQGPRGYPRQHLETYDTAADMALIKSLGFRHVRWTFNDATVVLADKPGQLDPEKMKIFDAALDMMLKAGLAVIVDFHPEDDYKHAVEKDDAAADNFVSMWRGLAKHLSSRDPERVFFEVMNEPVVKESARWNAIQKKTLAAMRESAPKHTFIATGAQWSSVEMLEQVEVVADRNVVYNFHCYEPFKFTHQQATWTWGPCKYFKNMPYPSSPEAVAKILPDITNDEARKYAVAYGKEQWTAEKLDAVIARAGWAMWDYAGGFSVATGKPGERVADPDTVKALGLTMPK